MKKLFSLIFVLLFPIGILAQDLTVSGRTTGAGINFYEPIIKNNPAVINSFEMTIYGNGFIKPISFTKSNLFNIYLTGWTIDVTIIGDTLRISGHGNIIHVQNGDVLGTLGFYVSKDSPDSLYYPFISFLANDSIYWNHLTGKIRVLNFPFSRYGDPNNSGYPEIGDWNYFVNNISNDTNEDSSLVIMDLDGNGRITDRDVSWLFSVMFNIDNRKYWPIFDGLDIDFTTNIIKNKDNKVLNQFSLEQNYPNPFNPITKISYSIPSTEFINLTVYNVIGIEIATLINEEKPTGNYKIKFDGSGLSSGIYFYKFTAGDFVKTKKMTFIK